MNAQNVFIINCDDLGFYDIPANGHPFIQTPYFLDDLSANGINCIDAKSGASVCSPSRAALLTGMNSGWTGFHNVVTGNASTSPFELRPELSTLFEELQNAGYTTGQFGKNHVINDESLMWQHGFDYHFSLPQTAAKVYLQEAKNAIDIIPSDFKIAFYLDPVETHFPLDLFYPDASDTLVWSQFGYDTLTLEDEEIIPHFGKVHTPELSDLKKYYGAITNLDFWLKDFFDHAAALGHYDPTKDIVIFTSDNGPSISSDYGSSGPNYSGVKGNHNEGGVAVPFIIRHDPSGLTGGVYSDQLIGHVDIYPTVLGILGLNCQAWKLAGEDVSSLLSSRGGDRKRGIYFNFSFGTNRFPLAQNANVSSLNPVTSYYTKDGNYKLIAGMECLKSGVSVLDWARYGAYVDVLVFDRIADPFEQNPIPQTSQIYQDVVAEFNKIDSWERVHNIPHNIDNLKSRIRCRE